MFSLFQNQSMILDLINPDVGESGVEKDDRLKDGKGTRLTKSTRNEKRRVDGQAQAAIEALIAQSAEKATAFKKQSDLAERTTLSQTLKNLNDAAADPNISSLWRVVCSGRCWRGRPCLSFLVPRRDTMGARIL